jgi:hypothetical protein
LRWAILDTNIYIGHWERGMYEEALSAIRKAFIVRHSAVVLSELRRGARTRDAQRLVASLWRLASTRWEPTASDWWEAGRIIRTIGDAQNWERNRPGALGFTTEARRTQRFTAQQSRNQTNLLGVSWRLGGGCAVPH